MSPSSVDENNLKEFTSRASQWWDPEGPFKPLHDLNPTRIDFIMSVLSSDLTEQPQNQKKTKKINDLHGLKILDVGCGGGLVTEALAKEGALMTGLDAGVENIQEAERHAAEKRGEDNKLSIHYVCSTLEGFLPKALFDVVLALEIVEHVTCRKTFVSDCLRVLKPGGILILSTLNRTWKSFALGIVAAEYVLKWVPRGTHNWDQFVRPSELAKDVRHAGGNPKVLKGLVYRPLTKTWSLSEDIGVNYFLVASKG